jgi:ABC-type molybdate transport system substrate-binding protein
MRLNFHRFFNLLFLLLIAVAVFSCRNSKKENLAIDRNANELTIYCENSLAPLMVDLKPEFEKNYDCDLQIINGCSQNLIGLMKFSGKGDLFFPDTKAAFDHLREISDLKIVDSVFVGYNRLVIVVPHGNPRQIHGNLSNIVLSGYSLILANPETSSLGYEVKNELTKRHLYDLALKNAIRLTVDSKGIDKRLINQEADYAICWQSDLYSNGFSIGVDTIEIEPELAYEIYGGVLSSSKNVKLAKYFIDFVSSDFGIASAQNHGIKRRRTQIF